MWVYIKNWRACLSLNGLKLCDITWLLLWMCCISSSICAQKGLWVDTVSHDSISIIMIKLFTPARGWSPTLFVGHDSSHFFSLGTSVLASSSFASARLQCKNLWEPQRELAVCWYTHWFSFQETAWGVKPIEKVSNYERKATLVSRARSEHWKLSKTTEKKTWVGLQFDLGTTQLTLEC